MSSWPKAASVPESSAIRRRNRWANGTPRVWMPTSATPGEVGIALDDLVRDPRQRFRDRLGIEDGRRCRGVRAQGAFRVWLTFDYLSRPHGTGLCR